MVIYANLLKNLTYSRFSNFRRAILDIFSANPAIPKTKGAYTE